MHTGRPIARAIISAGLGFAAAVAFAQSAAPRHGRERAAARDTQRIGSRAGRGDAERVRQMQRDRIYGANLMTVQERTQYEQRLHALATVKERVQFRIEHERAMRQRARLHDRTAASEPSRAAITVQEQERQRERERIYGYPLMTAAEVARYRAQLRAASTDQEREQIRATHHRAMQQRARERGVALPN